MTKPLYDVAIIGGGINGAGIAADAAARGLRVILLEQNDLASATSSASSKLIHGGLRYLEHYDFRLVREALQEREVLLAKAPHIIWPLRFVLPHVETMRARALIRAGLFIYDHLARRRQLPASSSVDLTRDPMGRALKPQYSKGFSYYDCWADDARLVVLNACAAARDKAEIKTRTQVMGATVAGGLWNLQLTNSGTATEIAARALVNAAGPWVENVDRTIGDRARLPHRPQVRLVKGSHIVVPRLASANDAFILQSNDGRVVFALPYEQRFTLIGTTDVAYSADPARVEIDEEEIGYLLSLANRFFDKPLSRADILWQYSGVRPLFDDGAAHASDVSRDYRLELARGTPPLVTVLGGKLTTYRRLAKTAVDKLAPYFPGMGPCTTAATVLPGGDIGDQGIDGWRREAYRRWPSIAPGVLDILIRRYGTLTADVLGDARSIADLGTDLGGRLFEREVHYLRDKEWAREPDDVLWRRTKAGLHMTPSQLQKARDIVQAIL